MWKAKGEFQVAFTRPPPYDKPEMKTSNISNMTFPFSNKGRLTCTSVPIDSLTWTSAVNSSPDQ
jgi:hypothetical protein